MADSPALASFTYKSEQPLERDRHAARGNLRGQAAEAHAVPFRAAADHHEILRDRLAADLPHAALKSEAGDVMAAAAVRAAADLDLQIGRRRDELRMLAQMIAEKLAEPARLRHGELARLGARAARHVGDRPGIGQPHARRRELPIQLGHGVGRHPAEHEVLLGRHANRAIGERRREIAEDAHLLAREIAERNRRVHEEIPALLLLAARWC